MTRTNCDEAGHYVVPNVLSPRDLVSRPDNMDKTVLSSSSPISVLHVPADRKYVTPYPWKDDVQIALQFHPAIYFFSNRKKMSLRMIRTGDVSLYGN